MRGAAARSLWSDCGSRARRRGARPSTRAGACAEDRRYACSTCRLVIAGVLCSIAAVDDAQTISLSKGPRVTVPTRTFDDSPETFLSLFLSSVAGTFGVVAWRAWAFPARRYVVALFFFA